MIISAVLTLFQNEASVFFGGSLPGFGANFPQKYILTSPLRY